ncbi:MAG: HNH endonuclease, partial [Muribaculaceae bacterium]|nr:HNH endonuclease [Muribaculaceae bacterium]
DEYVLSNEKLIVSTHTPDGLRKFAIIIITFENDKYIHAGTTFFDNDTTKREIAFAKGIEWTGGDTFDDYY